MKRERPKSAWNQLRIICIHMVRIRLRCFASGNLRASVGEYVKKVGTLKAQSAAWISRQVLASRRPRPLRGALLCSAIGNDTNSELRSRS